MIAVVKFFLCALLFTLATLARGETLADVCTSCDSGKGDAEACAKLFAVSAEKTNIDCESACDSDACGLASTCFEDIEGFSEGDSVVVFTVEEKAQGSVKQADLKKLGDALKVDSIATIKADGDLTARDCQTLVQMLVIESKSLNKDAMKGTPNGFAFDTSKNACLVMANGDGEPFGSVADAGLLEKGKRGPQNCKADDADDDDDEDGKSTAEASTEASGEASSDDSSEASTEDSGEASSDDSSEASTDDSGESTLSEFTSTSSARGLNTLAFGAMGAVISTVLC